MNIYSPGISLPSSGIMPSATPAPLHDIVGPLPFFPYTTNEIIFSIVLFLLLAGGLIWGFRKLRQKPALTSREKMLQALVAMKGRLMEGSDHEFGVLVSGLLRDYLGTVFLLAAPRQTTEEFLDSLRGNSRFTTLEQESLRHFLSVSDLLKFANGKATESERLALIIAAEHFIQGDVAHEVTQKEEKR